MKKIEQCAKMIKSSKMLIGIDLDNIIISYDKVFHKAALDKQYIPKGLSPTKYSVQKYMESNGYMSQFTFIQGLVYGLYICDAIPMPDVLQALQKISMHGHSIVVISHKTKYPLSGKKYDLHESASEWLCNKGTTGLNSICRNPQVYFEDTHQAKIRRIKLTNCDYFIDDLLKVVRDVKFPTKAIYYNNYISNHSGLIFSSWTSIAQYLCTL